MPMVVSNRQRIFYRYEGEKGAYLLFHHGLFGSHQDWYDAGYVEALASDFRLILPDARGHGRSDHPLKAEDYTLSLLADDVIAIMEELRIRNLHFLGYSLGALVGLEMLLRHPDRVRITMMCGESPFVTEEMMQTWRDMATQIQAKGYRAAVEALRGAGQLTAAAQGPEQEGEELAALALLEALGQVEPPRFEGRLTVNSPVALFIGENDPAAGRVQEARQRIHRARFVSLQGLDHPGLFAQREALLGEVMRLVRPGRKGGEATEDGEDGGARRGRAARGRGDGDSARQADEEARQPAAPPEPVVLTPPPPVDVETPRRQQEPAFDQDESLPGIRVRHEPPEAHETQGSMPGAAPEPLGGADADRPAGEAGPGETEGEEAEAGEVEAEESVAREIGETARESDAEASGPAHRDDLEGEENEMETGGPDHPTDAS